MIARQIKQHPNRVNNFSFGIHLNNLENIVIYIIWPEVYDNTGFRF